MSQHHINAGWTAAEIATHDTLYALRQATQNQSESFIAYEARITAADLALQNHRNAVGQRLFAASGPHDNGMQY